MIPRVLLTTVFLNLVLFGVGVALVAAAIGVYLVSPVTGRSRRAIC